MGPTASGKTGVAVELVQRLPLEIVSVDSALVYRGMDIGTAKPDAETLRRAPHHLIDLIDPIEAYSAARFREDALRVMAEITARGRVPLLVGGTMLYFKALWEGLSELPQADAALRAEIEREAVEHGWPALHAELAKLDPQTAQRLKPADAQRIQRALEVVRLTGKSMSQVFSENRSAALPYRVLPLALVPSDRAVLHARIAQRFAAMLEAGLVEELRRLRQQYPLKPGLPSMRCVGYRQVWEALDAGLDLHDKRTLADVTERGIAATRQLAKRQVTWLRSMPQRHVLACDSGLSADALAEQARGIFTTASPHRPPA
jgi:tRNA dimethylallyltransferase